ncbi:hypothetical protein DFH07DRAFT_956586 [Mycena maculata]|uniref:Uncharacterized protein n=1 Tax=Mycena maculata TaxID=230809 RepID=A0AAD7NJS4_9AGAR|nr:hypothetical protein DFH07DRAFT_956586 [Mycena maculata]
MSLVDASPGTTSAMPTTLETLSLKQTLRFTRLLSNLKHDIIAAIAWPSRILTTEAPDVLPPSIKTFLAATLVISEDLVAPSQSLPLTDMTPEDAAATFSRNSDYNPAGVCPALIAQVGLRTIGGGGTEGGAMAAAMCTMGGTTKAGVLCASGKQLN